MHLNNELMYVLYCLSIILCCLLIVSLFCSLFHFFVFSLFFFAVFGKKFVLSRFDGNAITGIACGKLVSWKKPIATSVSDTNLNLTFYKNITSNWGALFVFFCSLRFTQDCAVKRRMTDKSDQAKIDTLLQVNSSNTFKAQFETTIFRTPSRKQMTCTRPTFTVLATSLRFYFYSCFKKLRMTK